jgi:hypothetical protein
MGFHDYRSEQGSVCLYRVDPERLTQVLVTRGQHLGAEQAPIRDSTTEGIPLIIVANQSVLGTLIDDPGHHETKRWPRVLNLTSFVDDLKVAKWLAHLQDACLA